MGGRFLKHSVARKEQTSAEAADRAKFW